MNLYEIIKKLQNTQGSEQKQKLIRENKNSNLLKAYLKAVYDPSLSYYQTKVKRYRDNLGYSFTEGTLKALQNTLAHRELTGDAAKKWLDNLMKASNDEAQELIELLIKRSIGAGVGETTILKEIPTLWFSVPYQRCSLMDAKIKSKFENLSEFLVQEKLDGSFCYLVKEVGKPAEAITRAGSKYPKEFAEKLATGLPDGFVVVGELLVYGEVATLGVPLDRKTGNGILNSILKGGEVGDNLGFELTAWDCLTVGDFKAGKSPLKYCERLCELDIAVADMPNAFPVVTHSVKSLDEAYTIYSKFTADGKEGAVIKDKYFLWKDGTSKECVKLKIEFECDLEVVSITEGAGKAKGMMGSITLKSSDGIIVTDCGSGFSDKDRQEWWWGRANRIGSIVTIRANDIISSKHKDSLSLFLPIFLEIRLDKHLADSSEYCMLQLKAAKGLTKQKLTTTSVVLNN